jgi:hypothetical protein
VLPDRGEMSGLRKSLGVGAIALLPIACCIGVPLLVAAGIGAAAFLWGGAIVGGVVLIGAVAVVLVRRRARAAACRVPPRESATQQARTTQ